ncbi:NAD-dependent epimerase/dehydratase family protein [Saccharopolyspora hirsuta]|uniref:NAD-dependent epimerase/dehydratase family protein n=1 Tax=Saccharopolyspora hirsuta TaxID=1837 RepID=UPI00332281C6
MRILVLGGTVFVGHAVAAAALERGHGVVCAARGASGDVPEGAELVVVDRAEGLGALAGERFDAVVDVARSYQWVREALDALGDAGHWTFVSTINVYSDNKTTGQNAGGALLAPITDSAGTSTPESYGGIKVACENAVRAAMGDRAFVVRPGLITGPHDPTDRFGYWPLRLSRGGRVLAPDTPGAPIQHIDVRDLATWIVTAAERGLAGPFDGVGPVSTLGALLAEIASLVAPPGTEIAAVAPDALDEAGVQRWSGPKSLPLWIPDDYEGLASHDAAPSLAAGLRVRPLADTVSAALATERALGADRARKAGLTAAEEAELLGTLPSRPW